MNILVVRPDRIGDVVLSTPIFEVLKKHYPQSRLTVMVRESVIPLVQGLPSVDDVMTFDPEGRHKGLNGLFQLISEFRAKQFRVAVVLHSHWKVAAALFASGVLHRVGPVSKLHSYLFYNRGVRQRRSHVEMHETDYNLQLLRRLGIRAGTRNVATQVSCSDVIRKEAREWLTAKGWDGKSRLVAVHPGMGGSALNWPEDHYAELIRALVKEGHSILVTAGPSEGTLLGRLQDKLGSVSVMTYGGPGIGPVDFLAGLLSWADLVVAPSTGPLHVAVALGKPVVTFYPPIRVQSAIRWGPYVLDDLRASILVPEVYCGEDFHCRGNLCNYFPCMKTLTVQQALEQVHHQLASIGESKS